MTSDLAPELIVYDQWEKGAATVAVQGEIDIGTVGVFSGCLADVIGRNPHRLVIDMTGVGFLDSSGLHAFVRVRKDLPEDCTLVLRAPQSHVRQVFEISGLSTVFTFELSDVISRSAGPASHGRPRGSGPRRRGWRARGRWVPRPAALPIFPGWRARS